MSADKATPPARRQVLAALLGEPEVGGTTSLKAGAKSVQVWDVLGTREFRLDGVVAGLRASTGADLFRVATSPLVDAAVEGGLDAACLLYGTTACGKGTALLGSSSGGLLAATADAAFDAATRLRSAMGSDVTFSLSLLDVLPDGAVYNLGAGFPERQPARAVSETGSIASMPSLNDMGSPEASPRELQQTAQQQPRRDALLLQVEEVDGRTAAVGATLLPVTSTSEVASLVDAGLELRAQKCPYDPAAAHTVVTLHVTRRDRTTRGGELCTVLHLVNLAGAEQEGPTGPQADFAALQLLMRGNPQEIGSAGSSSVLARLLAPALTGTAQARLLAMCSLQSLASAVPTLAYAEGCRTVKLQTPVVTTLSPEPEYVVIDHDGAVDKLHREIGDLRTELKHAHSHYQQLLDKHAPGVLARGPMERDGTDSEQYAEDYGEEEEEEEDEGDKGGASSAPAAAGDSVKPPVSARRSIRGISAITTAKSALGGRAAARAAEVKIKQLEEQLERQKHRNETLESQMLALKDQLLAVKEKRMQSDHLHYKQSKKLTEAAKLTKEQQEAQAEQHLFQVQKEREEAAAKEAELKELNDGLRKDFNSLMESIPRFMEKRTGEVADEKSVRSTIRQETRDEMKGLISTAQGLASQQVANLKAQSQYLLDAKSEEIRKLKAATAAATAKAAETEAELSAELQYLYQYANKLAGIVQKVEAGGYPIRTLRGTKTYSVPSQDKPVPLNMDRLGYLTLKLAQTGKYDRTENGEAALASKDGSASMRSMPSVERTASRTEDGEAVSPAAFNSMAGEDTNQRDALRAEVEAAVLADLTSNETVEYIRGLEADVQRYRKEMQGERRRAHDLKVALAAAQRTPISPDLCVPFDTHSRNMAVRNIATVGAVPRPVNWGNPLGVAHSSMVTGARPGTAPEHLRSMRRPSTRGSGNSFAYRGGLDTAASFSLPSSPAVSRQPLFTGKAVSRSD